MNGTSADVLIQTFPTIKYMGSKTRLLKYIIPPIRQQLNHKDTFLDLFGGTNAVAYALKPYCRVITNDVQKYSQLISKVIICNPPLCPTITDVENDLKGAYSENFNCLKELFKIGMEKEEEFFRLWMLKNMASESLTENYKSFCETYPYYLKPELNCAYPSTFVELFKEETLDTYVRNLKRFPYRLFSTYFANGYFGIRQSAQIDSIRYAIDTISSGKNKIKKQTYLFALLSAISSSASTPGHFAQFLKVTSPKVCKSLLYTRSRDVFQIFLKRVQALSSLSKEGTDQNLALNMDYPKLLSHKKEIVQSANVIYADPPYSEAQYSRFYHVLETLVTYNYPSLSHVGRYPNGRYNTDFCRLTRVEKEFRKFFTLVKKLRKKLFVTYPSNGLLQRAGKDILKLAREFFNDVELISKIPYQHSTQGSPDNTTSFRKSVSELLIYCR